MKKLLFISFLFLSAIQTIKAQSVLDTIAINCCACLDSLQLNNPQEKITKFQMGICLLKKSKPYTQQLRDLHNIDLEILDTNSEKLGRKLGVKMVSICPQVFEAFINDQNDETAEEEEDLYATGIITKVNQDNFISFKLKNANGKTDTFYWLIVLSTDIDLPEHYKKLQNKEVEIYYFEQELFDPKILEYRYFKIITELKVIY